MFVSRIPELYDRSIEAMNDWFSAMVETGLAFHPDDDPETIVDQDGEPTFTGDECKMLRAIINELFHAHGDIVYECGLAHCRTSLGINELVH